MDATDLFVAPLTRTFRLLPDPSVGTFVSRSREHPARYSISGGIQRVI